MKRIFLVLTFLILANCIQKNPKDYSFEKIEHTDSTSYIQWTDGNIFYRSSKPIDNFYIDEKTYIKWSNEKYICLRHSNGSDTWTDIILPFETNNVKLIDNALAYDKLNGIVVFETDSVDYKLFAEKIQSGKRDYFGKDWEKCSSVFPHYCVDSISLSNKNLYVEWITPNFSEKITKRQIKKIRLTL